MAKAGDGSMRDALSLLDQCIAFYLGQTLTYDKVLEVLGAVDTEVFSKLLRKVLQGDVTGAIRTLEDLIIGGRELGQFVGDFTWYMRNLLLVKTSENPEEAIDVSSENLKLLREESEMVDVETLMRYTVFFSDLSSQIRYSTQKRVLVEIALIKLCRPAMETNLDSVLGSSSCSGTAHGRAACSAGICPAGSHWQRRKYRSRIGWQCRSHGSST